MRSARAHLGLWQPARRCQQGMGSSGTRATSHQPRRKPMKITAAIRSAPEPPASNGRFLDVQPAFNGMSNGRFRGRPSEQGHGEQPGNGIGATGDILAGAGRRASGARWRGRGHRAWPAVCPLRWELGRESPRPRRWLERPAVPARVRSRRIRIDRGRAAATRGGRARSVMEVAHTPGRSSSSIVRPRTFRTVTCVTFARCVARMLSDAWMVYWYDECTILVS